MGTPERVRTLMPAIKSVSGKLPIYFHSHCTSGLGPASNLEAIQYGADAVWTASTPLANGPSLPSDESMTDYLVWLGYETGMDRGALRETAAYFNGVARRYGKPIGRPAEYDPRLYAHQMPGGMINHFRMQLAELGLEDRLPAVLEEMPQVRQDLGWPNVQTPFAQFIGTQSLLNVLHGRYEIIPDEVRAYVLGYYGRTPAPVDADLFDRAARGEAAVSERPGAMVPPMVARIRQDAGPFESDEQLVLAMLFMPETLEKYRAGAAGALRTDRSVVDIVKSLAAAGGVRSVHLRMNGG